MDVDRKLDVVIGKVFLDPSDRETAQALRLVAPDGKDYLVIPSRMEKRLRAYQGRLVKGFGTVTQGENGACIALQDFLEDYEFDADIGEVQ